MNKERRKVKIREDEASREYMRVQKLFKCLADTLNKWLG
jgi:hypothetical protein